MVFIHTNNEYGQKFKEKVPFKIVLHSRPQFNVLQLH